MSQLTQDQIDQVNCYLQDGDYPDAELTASSCDDDLGGLVRVRFTSFSARVTPEITGHIDRLAADATVDEKSGASFYLAELKLDPGSLPAWMQGRLLPGMLAEVQIETGRRNALSYFLKPLTGQMSRSFREGCRCSRANTLYC